MYVVIFLAFVAGLVAWSASERAGLEHTVSASRARAGAALGADATAAVLRLLECAEQARITGAVPVLRSGSAARSPSGVSDRQPRYADGRTEHRTDVSTPSSWWPDRTALVADASVEPREWTPSVALRDQALLDALWTPHAPGTVLRRLLPEGGYERPVVRLWPAWDLTFAPTVPSRPDRVRLIADSGVSGADRALFAAGAAYPATAQLAPDVHGRTGGAFAARVALRALVDPHPESPGGCRMAASLLVSAAPAGAPALANARIERAVADALPTRAQVSTSVVVTVRPYEMAVPAGAPLDPSHGVPAVEQAWLSRSVHSRGVPAPSVLAFSARLAGTVALSDAVAAWPSPLHVLDDAAPGARARSVEWAQLVPASTPGVPVLGSRAQEHRRLGHTRVVAPLRAALGDVSDAAFEAAARAALTAAGAAPAPAAVLPALSSTAWLRLRWHRDLGGTASARAPGGSALDVPGETGVAPAASVCRRAPVRCPPAPRPHVRALGAVPQRWSARVLAPASAPPPERAYIDSDPSAVLAYAPALSGFAATDRRWVGGIPIYAPQEVLDALPDATATALLAADVAGARREGLAIVVEVPSSAVSVPLFQVRRNPAASASVAAVAGGDGPVRGLDFVVEGGVCDPALVVQPVLCRGLREAP